MMSHHLHFQTPKSMKSTSFICVTFYLTTTFPRHTVANWNASFSRIIQVRPAVARIKFIRSARKSKESSSSFLFLQYLEKIRNRKSRCFFQRVSSSTQTRCMCLAMCGGGSSMGETNVVKSKSSNRPPNREISSSAPTKKQQTAKSECDSLKQPEFFNEGKISNAGEGKRGHCHQGLAKSTLECLNNFIYESVYSNNNGADAGTKVDSLPRSYRLFNSEKEVEYSQTIFTMITVNRKSRFVLKDAENVILAFKNLAESVNRNSVSTCLYVLGIVGASPLCSKAKARLQEQGIFVFIPPKSLVETLLASKEKIKVLKKIEESTFIPLKSFPERDLTSSSTKDVVVLPEISDQVLVSTQFRENNRISTDDRGFFDGKEIPQDWARKKYGEFELKAPYSPTGDQPKAIKDLVDGFKNGYNMQTLMGATGTGKTFVMANVIAQIQKPTLVMAHNKTLAAQLCNELRAYFPNNAVEYFVSYYDYYQPEAYVAATDTYIDKAASINEDIDRFRISATRSLFERRDVIVVSSVSCIYGLGMPREYLNSAIHLQAGKSTDMSLWDVIRELVRLQYVRNDTNLTRGAFRVRGDVLDIGVAWEDSAFYRLEFFGDEIEKMFIMDTTTGKIISEEKDVTIYPAKHFITPKEQMYEALGDIEQELETRMAEFENNGKILEAERLRQRVQADLEMLRTVGYCGGVENYSRHLARRKAGQPPECLLDYFPKDWFLIVDESHVTIPQIGGMFEGDRSRKNNLVEYGFRLPSALDNRPLKAEEFWSKVKCCLFTSATPKDTEIDLSRGRVIEQIIRPTGIVDPEISVRPTMNQMKDLLGEIGIRIDRQERTLVTTLTKKMAEDMCDYMRDKDINVSYLHSDLDSIGRLEVLEELVKGEVDVVIGVNLLREGLDLPSVSLVAIMDADKEGFLRSTMSLIQTIGRAARNINGAVIMYADSETNSMKRAIEETERRRRIQLESNKKMGKAPLSIVAKNRQGNILDSVVLEREKKKQKAQESAKKLMMKEKRSERSVKSESQIDENLESMDIEKLEIQMKEAAVELRFEDAARIRDLIQKRSHGRWN